MKRMLMLLMALMMMTPAVMAESTSYRIDGKDADRVHLRQGPSTQADSLGLYFAGTGVTVIERDADWARVMIGDVRGYMMSSFLTREAIAPRGPWYKVDNPQSGWANLRLSPSMEGEAILHPNIGTAVRVLGETADGWSYVDCNGTKGYMKTKLLSPMENAYTLQRTTVLAQEGLGLYIHQYIAPNGQVIYFTAHLEEPIIAFTDVDFDGHDDIVITTGRWAKCDSVRFYRYDVQSAKYYLVQQTAIDEGLLNYALYPEYGLAGTYIANGNAGLSYEACLYRWEGGDLKIVRRAVSEEVTKTEMADGILTTTIDTNRFHCTVYDYTTGEDGGHIIGYTTPQGHDDYVKYLQDGWGTKSLWHGLR